MPQFQTNAPETLYKYRSVDKNDFERDLNTLFTERSLYLASPPSLNDPFDCRPAFGVPDGAAFEPALAEYEQLFPAEQRREVRRRANILKTSRRARLRYAEEYYRKELSGWGVVALSSKRDVPLLWAHYSDGYKGYAIGYRGRDTDSGEALGAVEVDYKETRPVLNALANSGEDPLELLATKSADWRHEAEWRYVRPPQMGGVGPLPVPRNAIVELVLGPLISTEHSSALLTAARALDDKPRVLQTSFNQEQYGLTFEPH